MPAPIAPSSFSSADNLNSVIKESLGIDQKIWNRPLVRINVPNPLNNNPRLPSGLEVAANPQFIRGGYTPKGIAEIIIDPVLIGTVKTSPVIRELGK